MGAYGESYLRPTAPTAADAILTGDPKRAMDLAARLMDNPLMSNLSRGLWGYHGALADGRELTVQSTGIGGPSAAAVLRDLAGLGVQRAIRIGTARGMAGVGPGDRVVVTAALPCDGISAALTNGTEALPDRALTAALANAIPDARSAVIATADLLDSEDARWGERGAVAVDLCTASLLAMGAALGVAVASVVLVTSAGDESLDDESVAGGCLELGAAAAAETLG